MLSFDIFKGVKKFSKNTVSHPVCGKVFALVSGPIRWVLFTFFRELTSISV